MGLFLVNPAVYILPKMGHPERNPDRFVRIYYVTGAKLFFRHNDSIVVRKTNIRNYKVPRKVLVMLVGRACLYLAFESFYLQSLAC